MSDTDRTASSTGVEPSILICLPSRSGTMHDELLAAVVEALDGEPALVASPECGPSPAGTQVQCIAYERPRSDYDWTLTAADYAAANALLRDSIRAVLLIANGAKVTPRDIRSLLDVICGDGQDLAVPRYALSSGEGLVNAAMVYPLTRTLFGQDIRFPLSSDICMSPRMLRRMATGANRLVSQRTPDAMLWPVAEAAAAQFSVRELEGTNLLPAHGQDADFNDLFSMVTGSLFTDIEARATFWQRARPSTPVKPTTALEVESPADVAALHEEVRSMVEGFRLAFANLQEIWSLVLPPQSRLALKKLSLLPADNFDFPSELWARCVYDFALAFHGRTLNRGHLLGAMAPIYLAWAASQLHLHAQDERKANERLDHVAAAFDQEKPYFVSRWRWPDRFNP